MLVKRAALAAGAVADRMREALLPQAKETLAAQAVLVRVEVAAVARVALVLLVQPTTVVSAGRQAQG
jgi:hypothetical protein